MRYQGAVLGWSGCRLTWRPRGLSKSVMSRVIIGGISIEAITYNSTYNLLTKSPGPRSRVQHLGFWGFVLSDVGFGGESFRVQGLRR